MMFLGHRLYASAEATTTLLVTLVTLIDMIAAVKIFPSPGALPSDIPAACRAVLSSDIACGPRLIRPSELEYDFPFNSTFLGEYCNSTCIASLGRWVSNINTRCGDTQYNFGNNISQSANDIAIPLKWAQDTACLTGTETGGTMSGTGYCLPGIVNHTATVCDDCTLKYLASMLASAYGARKIDEATFSSILSSCKASSTQYPHTTITIPPAPPLATSMPNIPACLGGKNYTVQSGDSCKSIANANSLALDNFLYLNGIDFNCSALSVGAAVCIRDSCKLHMVQANETCQQILAGQKFTKSELVQWNPILETGCDQMGSMVGRTICITPPGSDSYDVTITASFNDTFTWPSGSWVPAPTQGTPAGTNATADWQFVIPTTTMTSNSGTQPTAYYQYCPVTSQDYDDGFDWELVSPECSSTLWPYCEPVVTTGTPLPSPSFPASCMPSNIVASMASLVVPT